MENGMTLHTNAFVALVRGLLLGASLWAPLEAQAASCDFPGEPDRLASVGLERVVGGLARPVALRFLPTDAERYLVLEQYGLIKRGRLGATRLETVLDLTGVVNTSGNETGLL